MSNVTKRPAPQTECPRCGRLVQDCPRASLDNQAHASHHEALDCRAHEYLMRALKAEDELEEMSRTIDVAIAERDAAVAARVATKQELDIACQERDEARRLLADECRPRAPWHDWDEMARLLYDEAKPGETGVATVLRFVEAVRGKATLEKERDAARAGLAGELDKRRTALEALRMTYDDHKRLLDIISPDLDLTLEEGGVDRAIEIVTSTRKARDVAESACSTWAREAELAKWDRMGLVAERDRIRVALDVSRHAYLTVVDAIAKETASPEDAARIARETRQERDRLREYLDRVLDERNSLKLRLDDLANAAGLLPENLTAGVVHDMVRDQARVQLLEQELSEQRRARILAENERMKMTDRFAAAEKEIADAVADRDVYLTQVNELSMLLTEASEPGETVAETARRLVRMAVSSEEMCRAMERRGRGAPCSCAKRIEHHSPSQRPVDVSCECCGAPMGVGCLHRTSTMLPSCQCVPGSDDGLCACCGAAEGDPCRPHAAPTDDVATRRLPPSQPSAGPVIAGLVAADLFARAAEGERQYGQPLRPFNGRPAGIDRYQESLDRAMYDRQDIEEKRAMLARVRDAIQDATYRNHAPHILLADLHRWLAPYEANPPAQAPQPIDGHPTPEWVTRQEPRSSRSMCLHVERVIEIGVVSRCGKPALPDTDLPRCAEHASKYRAPTHQVSSGPVCATCQDTHRVRGDGCPDFDCPDCLPPCHKCVDGRTAFAHVLTGGHTLTMHRPYCATTPCPCLCHQPALNDDRNEDPECPECGHLASDHRPQINGTQCGAAVNEPCMCRRKS